MSNQLAGRWRCTNNCGVQMDFSPPTEKDRLLPRACAVSLGGCGHRLVWEVPEETEAIRRQYGVGR